MIIEDQYELLALHRALFEAKFVEEPRDPVVPGSRIIADLANRLVDELAAQKPDWQKWRAAAQHTERVDVVRRRIAEVAEGSNWKGWSAIERREFAETLLSPLVGNPALLDELSRIESQGEPKASPDDVVLDVATPADEPLLMNLLQLYIHDLSAAFPDVELGPDGRYGYEKLPLYWSEPERRFPFLVRFESRVVGFALITRGSPATDDPDVFDIAEFFVIRRHRRSGLGREAAFHLWDRFPARWTVRVSEGNAGALRFWQGVTDRYTTGDVKRSVLPGSPNAWRVFSFDSEAVVAERNGRRS
jgi:predicted acetyltransferase